jgi:hypothetical protein
MSQADPGTAPDVTAADVRDLSTAFQRSRVLLSAAELRVCTGEEIQGWRVAAGLAIEPFVQTPFGTAIVIGRRR